MWWRGALALVLGVAVGVGAAYAARPRATATEVRAAACETRRVTARQRLDEVGDDIAEAERVLFLARLARAAAVGRLRPWPDEPAPLLAADALRAHLEEAIGDGPGELVELDCSAYPCVATLSWEHLPEDEGLIDAGGGQANMPGRLLAQLQGEGDYASLPFVTAGRLHDGVDGVSVFSMAWYTPDDYRAAKSPTDDAQLNGTVLDQLRGRAEELADGWAEKELP